MKKEHFEALSGHLSDKPTRENNKTQGDYKYKNPKTGEVFTYTRKGTYRKDGTILIYNGRS